MQTNLCFLDLLVIISIYLIRPTYLLTYLLVSSFVCLYLLKLIRANSCSVKLIGLITTEGREGQATLERERERESGELVTRM